MICSLSSTHIKGSHSQYDIQAYLYNCRTKDVAGIFQGPYLFQADALDRTAYNLATWVALRYSAGVWPVIWRKAVKK